VKPRLAARSDSDDQEPPPAASSTPAVGVPVLVSIAEMKRAPPVVRAVNVSGPYEPMSQARPSAQTREPKWVALALFPAAKLYSPLAVLL